MCIRDRISAAELTEVGLAMPRRSGRGVYDRFRGRVLFPIRDATGNATGLGGRILPAAPPTAANAPHATAPEPADEPVAGSQPAAGARTASARQPAPDPDGPKYLNSPATPLFDKSRTLYPLDRAKAAIRKSGIAVIVEGYTDALMAHQAGFDNVVASLGTALTPGQIALLTRYAAKKIVLAYDVDPAGELLQGGDAQRAGALPRRVHVVGKHDLLRGVAREERNLARHERVRIPLHDHGDPRLADGGLRAVQRVERPALVEERRRRGVEVLRAVRVRGGLAGAGGPRPGGGLRPGDGPIGGFRRGGVRRVRGGRRRRRQDAAAEAGGVAGRVADREEDPAPEAVVDAPAAPAGHLSLIHISEPTRLG